MSKKPSSAAVITAGAPAKINLGLRVLGKRPDGYHNVQSLMVPVSLYDELRLELGSRGVTLSCPNSDLPTDAQNLVYRAAQLVLDQCQRDEGVRIELKKSIPVSAGLGGGSSDAATTLLAVNQLLGSPLAVPDLHPLAVKLGADVPFFLLGRWAMAEGIGDRLTPINNVPTFWTVLMHPHYENLTLTTGPNGSKFNILGDTSAGEMTTSHQRLLDRRQPTLEDLLPLLVNDFEPLVFGHYPQLHDLREILLAADAKAVAMTGSGPTLVGLFGSEEEARAGHDLLCRRDDSTSFVAHTLDTTTLLTSKFV
jgi:4-diphosphocytidyl-2-C-methyl-D-erythritol kinase